ncbi:2TM domain-containing protein [Dokdonia sp. Asnod3-C12]|uniref:2TM domain-containing protein n=1 Tax=Dokdonia sp. Asnod3-C12 TaxID=3160575 RepID=UPI00386CB565
MSLFSKKTTTSIDPVQKELIENAQARVRQKKNLYRHFVTFLAGAILLIVINQVLHVGEEFKPFQKPWFVWAILIWTFFFLIHLINVLLMSKFMNKEWEQKHLDRLVAKQKVRIAELEEDVALSHPLPEKKSPVMRNPSLPLEDQNTLL